MFKIVTYVLIKCTEFLKKNHRFFVKIKKKKFKNGLFLVRECLVVRDTIILEIFSSLIHLNRNKNTKPRQNPIPII